MNKSTIPSDQNYGSIFNINLASSSTTRYLVIIQCLSIYALVLIVVGTVGNILTIITLLRRNLRRLSTIRYLTVVSICDTISLYGWNLNNFYKFNISPNNDNLEELSLFHCRFFSFMTFVTLQLSSWCLTAVSVDRALNIYWPNWKRSYGKLKYTNIYITILTVICLALNSHTLVLNGYRKDSGEIKCYSTKDNPHYIYPNWERVHLVFYNLFPFALMCIANTYIIVMTVRSSRVQIDSTPSNGNQRKQMERYRQLTALLIIVTFAFVLLTLPACIYYVFFRQRFETTKERTYRYAIQIALNSIQFTSHAINFFLYCFSAKSFLTEFNDMFNEVIVRCHSNDSPSSSTIEQTRPVRGRVESASDRQQAGRQMKQYNFDFYPEFQSATDQNRPWN